jgi:hypothetical protein
VSLMLWSQERCDCYDVDACIQCDVPFAYGKRFTCVITMSNMEKIFNDATKLATENGGGILLH